MQKNMRQRSKTKVLLGLILAAALIAAFGTGLYLLEHACEKNHHTDTGDDGAKVITIGDQNYEITHNIESYLLIGTDGSGNTEQEGTEDYAGPLADFLMLLIMDRTDNTYGFLQIDRNTMTKVRYIERNGEEVSSFTEQICTASWYGENPVQGCENTVTAVRDLVGGLDIDGYYAINMSDIGTLNHAVGGVEVTLEDDFTKSDPAMSAGKTLVLNDQQAEIFVRGRMEIGEGTNAERMKRQQVYIKGFQSKAKSMMAADSGFLDDLYQMLADEAITDIPENRVSVIANQTYKGEDLGILTLRGETRLGTTLGDGLEHEEFYVETDSIAEAMMTLCGMDQ